VSIRRTIRRTGVVTALAAASVLLVTGTASAAITTVYHGDDYARFWHSSQNLYACDETADGHGVYAKYWDGNKTGTITDADGSAGGCSWDNVGSIDSFKVCHRINNLPDQCSGRVYV
jgi:hypothetical protein